MLAENNFLLANNGSAINNASGDPYLSRTMSRADNYQMNFTATYNRDFGSHHIGALFSIEKSEAESEYLVGQVTNPYEFTNGQSNLVQYNSASTTEFKRAESGTLSYIGRVNYAYADKYLFEFLLARMHQPSLLLKIIGEFFLQFLLVGLYHKKNGLKECEMG